MTTINLIESLKPGELIVRCADGTLLRTMALQTLPERTPASVRKLMQKVVALKRRKKR